MVHVSTHIHICSPLHPRGGEQAVLLLNTCWVKGLMALLEVGLRCMAETQDGRFCNH